MIAPPLPLPLPFRLWRDTRGVTIVEFAIIAPVMMMLLMGLGDVLYQPYIQSILDGAVQKAGRDSTLEDNAIDNAAIDARVAAAVGAIAKNARFTPERKSYSSFALIKPETIYDTNANGVLDSKECFDDINGNGKWDADPSRTGQGGADDVTRYTMRVTYTRPFPVTVFFGFPATLDIQSSTLLKNQPYRTQTTYTVAKVCLP